ncbi:MAG: DUF1538 domain-containing protein [Sulfurospirillaceae bacterium]|nr:DUF1538 domain-containing protein [Sulfurospirillaceae bacterium]
MLKESINIFLHDILNSMKDLVPIVIVISFFQIWIIGEVPKNLVSIIVGLCIIVFGLAMFIRGLEIGIFPVGENLATDFAKKGSLFWLLLFAFFLGFATTIAEPALIAIAHKASIISDGRIDAFFLRLTVAIAVGFAISIGVLRILLGHPVHYYIIAGYIIVVIITFFAPQQIIGLAYDSGGVTTSTVTVPLVAALGIGLASSIKGRNPAIDGFGLIAFASLTPMIFVQLYGIVVYNFFDAPTNTKILTHTVTTVDQINNLGFIRLFFDFLNVAKDVIPIILVIGFFQYFVIKKAIPHIPKVTSGIFMVLVGLYAFILGLEFGLFPIGAELATSLTSMKNVWYIYLFGFSIGFSTTMAEPALIAIASKANEISEGNINQSVLRISVALGVAIGISLGSYRIVHGDPIYYYIITGYIFVIILTYFAPKYIIPIAYDSGGVTTSTVTVPLVAALGLGLARNIPGRSVLIDGFGLIAFASLFPMITVMGYGILVTQISKRRK